MAARRMFSKTITDSDAFLDLPLTAQALYFHLSMQADDDGFVNNCRKIQRMVGCDHDDMQTLIDNGFLISFESGIVVIAHWKIHNYIQKDRYKPTVYAEEKAQLTMTPNGVYTRCIHDGYNLDTQVRLGKDRVRLGEGRGDRPPDDDSPKAAYGCYANVFFKDEELDKLKEEFPDDWKQRVDHLSKYMHSSGKIYANHLATIELWSDKDKEKEQAAGQTKDSAINYL